MGPTVLKAPDYPRTNPRTTLRTALRAQSRRDNSPDKPPDNPRDTSLPTRQNHSQTTRKPLGNHSETTRNHSEGSILAGGGFAASISAKCADNPPDNPPTTCPTVVCPAVCPALCPALCLAYRGGYLCRRAFVKSYSWMLVHGKSQKKPARKSTQPCGPSWKQIDL